VDVDHRLMRGGPPRAGGQRAHLLEACGRPGALIGHNAYMEGGVGGGVAHPEQRVAARGHGAAGQPVRATARIVVAARRAGEESLPLDRYSSLRLRAGSIAVNVQSAGGRRRGGTQEDIEAARSDIRDYALRGGGTESARGTHQQ